MDPSSTPQFTPAKSAPAASQPTPARRDKRQLVWGLICLIGPTALIVVSILAFALANFIGSMATGPEAFNTSPPLAAKLINVILFIAGALSVITWLPGVIIGII